MWCFRVLISPCVATPKSPEAKSPTKSKRARLDLDWVEGEVESCCQREGGSERGKRRLVVWRGL